MEQEDRSIVVRLVVVLDRHLFHGTNCSAEDIRHALQQVIHSTLLIRGSPQHQHVLQLHCLDASGNTESKSCSCSLVSIRDQLNAWFKARDDNAAGAGEQADLPQLLASAANSLVNSQANTDSNVHTCIIVLSCLLSTPAEATAWSQFQQHAEVYPLPVEGGSTALQLASHAAQAAEGTAACYGQRLQSGIDQLSGCIVQGDGADVVLLDCGYKAAASHAIVSQSLRDAVTKISSSRYPLPTVHGLPACHTCCVAASDLLGANTTRLAQQLFELDPKQAQACEARWVAVHPFLRGLSHDKQQRHLLHKALARDTADTDQQQQQQQQGVGSAKHGTEGVQTGGNPQSEKKTSSAGNRKDSAGAHQRGKENHLPASRSGSSKSKIPLGGGHASGAGVRKPVVGRAGSAGGSSSIPSRLGPAARGAMLQQSMAQADAATSSAAGKLQDGTGAVSARTLPGGASRTAAPASKIPTGPARKHGLPPRSASTLNAPAPNTSAAVPAAGPGPTAPVSGIPGAPLPALAAVPAGTLQPQMSGSLVTNTTNNNNSQADDATGGAAKALTRKPLPLGDPNLSAWDLLEQFDATLREQDKAAKKALKALKANDEQQKDMAGLKEFFEPHRICQLACQPVKQLVEALARCTLRSLQDATQRSAEEAHVAYQQSLELRTGIPSNPILTSAEGCGENEEPAGVAPPPVAVVGKEPQLRRPSKTEVLLLLKGRYYNSSDYIYQRTYKNMSLRLLRLMRRAYEACHAIQYAGVLNEPALKNDAEKMKARMESCVATVKAVVTDYYTCRVRILGPIRQPAPGCDQACDVPGDNFRTDIKPCFDTDPSMRALMELVKERYEGAEEPMEDPAKEQHRPGGFLAVTYEERLDAAKHQPAAPEGAEQPQATQSQGAGARAEASGKRGKPAGSAGNSLEARPASTSNGGTVRLGEVHSRPKGMPPPQQVHRHRSDITGGVSARPMVSRPVAPADAQHAGRLTAAGGIRNMASSLPAGPAAGGQGSKAPSYAAQHGQRAAGAVPVAGRPHQARRGPAAGAAQPGKGTAAVRQGDASLTSPAYQVKLGHLKGMQGMVLGATPLDDEEEHQQGVEDTQALQLPAAQRAKPVRLQFDSPPAPVIPAAPALPPLNWLSRQVHEAAVPAHMPDNTSGMPQATGPEATLNGGIADLNTAPHMGVATDDAAAEPATVPTTRRTRKQSRRIVDEEPAQQPAQQQASAPPKSARRVRSRHHEAIDTAAQVQPAVPEVQQGLAVMPQDPSAGTVEGDQADAQQRSLADGPAAGEACQVDVTAAPAAAAATPGRMKRPSPRQKRPADSDASQDAASSSADDDSVEGVRAAAAGVEGQQEEGREERVEELPGSGERRIHITLKRRPDQLCDQLTDIPDACSPTKPRTTSSHSDLASTGHVVIGGARAARASVTSASAHTALAPAPLPARGQTGVASRSQRLKQLQTTAAGGPIPAPGKEGEPAQPAAAPAHGSRRGEQQLQRTHTGEHPHATRSRTTLPPVADEHGAEADTEAVQQTTEAAGFCDMECTGLDACTGQPAAPQAAASMLDGRTVVTSEARLLPCLGTEPAIAVQQEHLTAAAAPESQQRVDDADTVMLAAADPCSGEGHAMPGSDAAQQSLAGGTAAGHETVAKEEQPAAVHVSDMQQDTADDSQPQEKHQQASDQVQPGTSQAAAADMQQAASTRANEPQLPQPGAAACVETQSQADQDDKLQPSMPALPAEAPCVPASTASKCKKAKGKKAQAPVAQPAGTATASAEPLTETPATAEPELRLGCNVCGYAAEGCRQCRARVCQALEEGMYVPGVSGLGCGTCRHGRRGCKKCRRKVGKQMRAADAAVWQHAAADGMQCQQQQQQENLSPAKEQLPTYAPSHAPAAGAGSPVEAGTGLADGNDNRGLMTAPTEGMTDAAGAAATEAAGQVDTTGTAVPKHTKGRKRKQHAEAPQPASGFDAADVAVVQPAVDESTAARTTGPADLLQATAPDAAATSPTAAEPAATAAAEQQHVPPHRTPMTQPARSTGPPGTTYCLGCEECKYAAGGCRACKVVAYSALLDGQFVEGIEGLGCKRCSFKNNGEKNVKGCSKCRAALGHELIQQLIMVSPVLPRGTPPSVMRAARQLHPGACAALAGASTDQPAAAADHGGSSPTPGVGPASGDKAGAAAHRAKRVKKELESNLCQSYWDNLPAGATGTGQHEAGEPTMSGCPSRAARAASRAKAQASMQGAGTVTATRSAARPCKEPPSSTAKSKASKKLMQHQTKPDDQQQEQPDELSLGCEECGHAGEGCHACRKKVAQALCEGVRVPGVPGLGCSRCKHSVNGCRTCRGKVGGKMLEEVEAAEAAEHERAAAAEGAQPKTQKKAAGRKRVRINPVAEQQESPQEQQGKANAADNNNAAALPEVDAVTPPGASKEPTSAAAAAGAAATVADLFAGLPASGGAAAAMVQEGTQQTSTAAAAADSAVAVCVAAPAAAEHPQTAVKPVAAFGHHPSADVAASNMKGSGTRASFSGMFGAEVARWQTPGRRPLAGFASAVKPYNPRKEPTSAAAAATSTPEVQAAPQHAAVTEIANALVPIQGSSSMPVPPIKVQSTETEDGALEQPATGAKQEEAMHIPIRTVAAAPPTHSPRDPEAVALPPLEHATKEEAQQPQKARAAARKRRRD